MSKLLDSLNPEQRQVAEIIHGPILVLAGAGSGKTRALTHRLAHMVEQKLAAPEEILAVTFTNKAAKEMRQRVAELLGSKHTVPGTIGTFHGLGARLLREMHQFHNRPRTFTIMDAKDSEKLLKEAMQFAGISPKQLSVKNVRGRISLAKNNMQTAAHLSASDSPIDQDIARVFSRYEKLLISHEAYDFDDLLLVPLDLLKQHPEVALAYQQRWRFLSVDEYQDTNPPQEELLRLLLGPEKNLCVVGDDYQAIYSWRGANVDHILRFEKRYPACKVIYLTQNYRSTPAILGAANKVIAVNKDQKHKKLWTERQSGQPIALAQMQSERHEATFVRQQIESWRRDGGKLSDCVVLYRTNAQSRVFEEEFLKHRVPYTIVGGFKFYERKEIKDALAFLTLWLNPGSALALSRLMESYIEGIGKKTVLSWREEAEVSSKPILHVLRDKGTSKVGLAKFLQAFVGAEEGIKDGSTVADVLSHLLTTSGYFAYLRQEPDGQERLENIQELMNVTAMYTDLAAFLEEVALLADLDSVDEKSDRVTCMSIHAAKGLEFPTVFLAGLEEGLLPHINSLADAAALEEERRLLYVAMTRAKEKLVITHSRARLMRGESTMQIPSRFLRDLPKDMIQEVILSGDQPSAHTFLDPILDEEISQVINEDDRPELRVNDFIRHTVLGRGVVIGTQGDKVTCVFEQHGVQAVSWREIEKLPELHFN